MVLIGIDPYPYLSHHHLTSHDEPPRQVSQPGRVRSAQAPGPEQVALRV
jgi:hypothetical protein